ncbi:hypothetical protein N7533_002533 [Penicillium manginii]|jgi:hypothetical protein|uniref:uncharacterized protein n=1 Tax=Penicillium manginii TaxID=203109 RepID=UPI0025495001|nr:uncharacterized protein N7533_002533 [Penicillium manginii]KAJ5763852.1 hypothetical protein N7533_002533 [Penicillium manginii]
MTSWHTYTKAHIPVTKITAWHIDPTIESYNNMSQAWRPTKIQILRKHPAVIDWIPWPSIRDKLITYHAANPLIDNVICAIGHSYVMEIDLSKLIANIPPTPGYVSVWDLIQAISPETSNKNTKASKDINLNTWNGLIGPRVSADESTQFQQNDESFGLRLPAPDTNTLFGSHSMALQAFKLLGMDKGASLFRLAPAFFETHPEMYDHRDNIMASGVHLKSPYSDTMISPRPLDVSVSTQYKQLSSWTVDLLVEGTLPVPRLHLDSD